MFGRHPKDRPVENLELGVSDHLEQDILSVEQSVGTYLQSPTPPLRAELLAALERLDAQIDLGDAYTSRRGMARSLGGSSVIGATGDHSMADEVPGTEFQEQVALVRAAKKEVTGPCPETLAMLHAANVSLAAFRTAQQAGDQPPG